MRLRMRTVGLIGVVAALLLAACGGDDDTPTTVPQATATSVPTATPAPTALPTATQNPLASTQELIYATGMAASVNPHQEGVRLSQLDPGFDRAINLAHGGEILEPGFVESWATLGDSDWQLTIREGIRWHDGQPLTAADVANYFNLTIETPFRQASSALPGVAAATAVGEYTVNLEMATPNVLLPRQLHYAYVLPKHYLDEVGIDGFLQAPMGSGPFRWVKWVQNQEAIAERVEYQHAWRRPKLERITILHMTEISTMVAALRTGQINLVQVDVTPETFFKLEEEGFKVAKPVSQVLSILLNPQTACAEGWATCDKRVRQALNVAVDKKLIAETIYGGTAEPVSQVAIPGTPGYNNSIPILFDPAEAERLLDEAGFPRGADGTRLELPLMDWMPGTHHDAFLAMIDMWGDVGITVTNEFVELAVILPPFRHEVTPPEMMGVRMNDQVGDNSRFATFLGPTAIGRYDNEEFLALQTEFLAEPDFDKRVSLMERMLLISNVEDPAYVYVVAMPRLFQMAGNLEEFVANGDNFTFDIDKLWFSRQ